MIVRISAQWKAGSLTLRALQIELRFMDQSWLNVAANYTLEGEWLGQTASSKNDWCDWK